ncbi:hypothetical protein G4B88_000643 [Cannabis sativa]|uniref:BED-type domain-containing protein n=1 Tax=Cannabis sativa TaxID=3483 RepID=A0A7J6HFQ8_CANSA|nr:hypothetical protein G4B88_000643 [Cannabis sativa]
MTRLQGENCSVRISKKSRKAEKDLAVEVERERAECIYCQADYAADTKNCGTSTLWSHIHHKYKKCPLSTFAEKSTKQTIITDHFTKTNQDSEVNSSGTRTSRFSQPTVRELIGKYFIIDELPVRHIEEISVGEAPASSNFSTETSNDSSHAGSPILYSTIERSYNKLWRVYSDAAPLSPPTSAFPSPYCLQPCCTAEVPRTKVQFLIQHFSQLSNTSRVLLAQTAGVPVQENLHKNQQYLRAVEHHHLLPYP